MSVFTRVWNYLSSVWNYWWPSPETTMANSSAGTKINLEDVFPDDLAQSKRDEYQKLSESEGLLHAIQKIIFDEWTEQLRDQVHKNCLEGHGDADRLTSFVYYKLNVQEHLDYLRNHIKNVETSFRIFNDIINKHIKSEVGIGPEVEDATEEQIKKHDDSKYSFFECVTYAAKWHKLDKNLEGSKQYWGEGWCHHYTHNEHHPEYFPEGTPMPWKYLTEAVYDMAAMQLDKTWKNVVPEPTYKLLHIPDQFLFRFNRTGQFQLVKDVLTKTVEYMSKNSV